MKIFIVLLGIIFAAFRSEGADGVVAGSAEPYREALRPRFHFTARSGWLNDPNGLVFYQGEYHFFFQHNPFGTEWGNMTWGHAISKDLVHWQQISNALLPDSLGDMFSGSAVVDWHNDSGFQTGSQPPMVMFYTAAGGQGEKSKGKKFTQCVAYSNDGRNFIKFEGNPVIGNRGGGDRDPKVFWHAASRQWIMALFVDEARGEKKRVNTVQFFSSRDLKQWYFESKLDDYFECPDFFELPVKGLPGQTRWVLFAADGNYSIGSFDGHEFKPEGKKNRGDHGPNFYAAQTYSDTPDQRRILVGWMRGGKYPQMPFNQQMAFPTELTLTNTVEGARLVKEPITEIRRLYSSEEKWKNVKVDEVKAITTFGIAADISMEVVPETGAVVTLLCNGEPITLDSTGKVACKGATIQLKAGPSFKFRVLMDDTSLEIFSDDGLAVLSACYLPDVSKPGIQLKASGPANLKQLMVHGISNIWNE